METVDQQLISQTKQQIRALVQEITDLADSDCSADDFYEGFLTRMVSALASVGGAIWIKNADNQLELKYQINLAQTSLVDEGGARQQHGQLLQKLIERGQPTLIAPQSGQDEEDPTGNPTDNLLVVGPLKVDQRVEGLVEIFQRAGAGPTTQRGYLRFVIQMSEIASNYLRKQRLRQFSDQQTLWKQLEQFIRAAHQSLDTTQTVYTVANEGRRLIDCDRVSLALKRGNRYSIQAVSGLDTMERRADQIKRLNRLTAAVVRGDEPLWYTGDDSDLPPQIEEKLHQYIDQSHSKMVAILPLRETTEDDADDSKGPGRPIAALIVEQHGDEQLSPSMRKRIEVVAAHSSDALTNAIAHNGVFLMPVWKRLGKVLSIFQAQHLPKTMIVFAAIAAIIAGLCLIPHSFTLSSNGELTPKTQFEIFAEVDGTLQEIFVPRDPDATVPKGHVLAKMTNNDFDRDRQELVGQLETAIEQKRHANRALSEQLNTFETLTIEKDLGKAAAQEKSLNRQIETIDRKLALLNISSPVLGHVVNWQVRQNLRRRPVRKGQSLMTIVPPDTDWEVELEMPERRVAHLIKAQQKSNEPLKVTFTLASHPGRQFVGKIASIDRKLEVRSDEGNSVRVRVAFDKKAIDPDLLRTGTRITAQVHCGTRSIGYVWFHELFETVQSTWMLWF